MRNSGHRFSRLLHSAPKGSGAGGVHEGTGSCREDGEDMTAAPRVMKTPESNPRGKQWRQRHGHGADPGGSPPVLVLGPLNLRRGCLLDTPRTGIDSSADWSVAPSPPSAGGRRYAVDDVAQADEATRTSRCSSVADQLRHVVVTTFVAQKFRGEEQTGIDSAEIARTRLGPVTR